MQGVITKQANNNPKPMLTPETPDTKETNIDICSIPPELIPPQYKHLRNLVDCSNKPKEDNSSKPSLTVSKGNDGIQETHLNLGNINLCQVPLSLVTDPDKRAKLEKAQKENCTDASQTEQPSLLALLVNPTEKTTKTPTGKLTICDVPASSLPEASREFIAKQQAIQCPKNPNEESVTATTAEGVFFNIGGSQINVCDVDENIIPANYRIFIAGAKQSCPVTESTTATSSSDSNVEQAAISGLCGIPVANLPANATEWRSLIEAQCAQNNISSNGGPIPVAPTKITINICDVKSEQIPAAYRAFLPIAKGGCKQGESGSGQAAGAALPFSINVCNIDENMMPADYKPWLPLIREQCKANNLSNANVAPTQISIDVCKVSADQLPPEYKLYLPFLQSSCGNSPAPTTTATPAAQENGDDDPVVTSYLKSKCGVHKSDGSGACLLTLYDVLEIQRKSQTQPP